MENENYYTESYFSVSAEELIQLAKIYKTYGAVNDIYISGIVADNTPKTGETIWDRRCEIASAYGVGYILGKRAERARQKLRATRKEKNA